MEKIEGIMLSAVVVYLIVGVLGLYAAYTLLKVLRNYIEYLIRTRNVKYLTLDEVKEMRKKSHD